MVQQSASFADTVVTSLAKAQQRRRGTAKACLIEIAGEEIGRRIPLERAEDLVVGRNPGCDVMLADESASRRHARFTRQGGAHILTDLGSTNGTFVNDAPITETQLRDGDRIRLGRTLFKYLTSRNVEAEYHEEIYRLMTTDSVTGVYNKRYFDEVLDREASRCHRYDRTFSLALLDIDHFKHVNDTHGHLAGDAVLEHLGHLLRNHVRRTDTVARLGGEEFGLLLPEVGLEGAMAVAQKIRRIVEAARFPFRGRTLTLTVSLGVAQWEPGLGSPSELVNVADRKLYDAKQSGRNRVIA